MGLCKTKHCIDSDFKVLRTGTYYGCCGRDRAPDHGCQVGLLRRDTLRLIGGDGMDCLGTTWKNPRLRFLQLK